MGGLADSHAAPGDTSSVEATYTSLIQQYLSVLCIDNATFLAERFVAACKTSHSYYLLAICHYRAGSLRRAQRVLEDCKDEHSPEMQYLLAKCYAELQQYGPAEDALLQNCRALFRKTEKDDIDEWILTTTPSPVPNGAAGLQLMGYICRNSNRKERAMHYFRLALKLDPMMWTSYEALCEMGDDSINPVQVFGVCPEALAPSPQDEEEEHAAQPYIESRGVLTPSFALSHHGKRNCNRETIEPNKSHSQ
jgi:anaphase-promoting complex subunit 3